MFKCKSIRKSLLKLQQFIFLNDPHNVTGFADKCFCPCQELVTNLMNQIQELRISIGEKSETIATLKQELQDINVSSVTGC